MHTRNSRNCTDSQRTGEKVEEVQLMRMLDLVLALGKLATHTKPNHCLFHYLATLFLNIYPRQQMCMSPETRRRMFQEQSCTQSQCQEEQIEAWRAHAICYTTRCKNEHSRERRSSACQHAGKSQNNKTDHELAVVTEARAGVTWGGAVLLTTGAPGVQRSLL